MKNTNNLDNIIDFDEVLPKIFSTDHSASDISTVMGIMLLILSSVAERLYSALYRSGGMRYANECCYCDEMFCDSVSDS